MTNSLASGPSLILDRLTKTSAEDLPPARLRIAQDRWSLAITGAAHAGRPNPVLHEIRGPETALLVVDMQVGFLAIGAAVEVAAGRDIIYNINRIAAELRAAGGTVVFFKYLIDDNPGLVSIFEGKSYLGPERERPLDAFREGHPQFELDPHLLVVPSDIVMTKTRFSAVHGSTIVDLLRERGISNVIVTGVTTDVCAGNTAECLMQLDYHVVMAWDGTAALDRLEHELFLAHFYGLYGDVMPTDEIVARIVQSAPVEVTPRFSQW